MPLAGPSSPLGVVILAVILFLAGAVSAFSKTDHGPIPSEGIVLPEFGKIPASAISDMDELFVVIRDKYPVSPGHSLIIPLRAVSRFQDLTDAEKVRLLQWIDSTQKHLSATLERKPDGFNFGLNDGPAAGQTKAQLHFHIIPRYIGDMADPRGGVRYVIPNKANYWDASQNKK